VTSVASVRCFLIRVIPAQEFPAFTEKLSHRTPHPPL
jgi:hypothetical protein